MARPASRKPRGGHAAQRLSTIRKLHLYLGALFAPSILFFALTGALQLFGLHETRPGRAYVPAPIVQALGGVHKDQVIRLKPAHAASAGAEGADHDHDHDHAAAPRRTRLATLALKGFFLAAAASLATTTLLGLWMAFTLARRPVTVALLLMVGTAVPVVLLAL